LFALGATGALRRRSDGLDLLHQRVRWIEEQLQHEQTTAPAPESHNADAEVVRLEPVAKQPLRPLERLVLVPTPADDGEGHVCLLATVGGYELHERPGVAPMANTLVHLGEGLWGEVVKVGRSPLPNDKRRCAYLLQPVSAATSEEEMPGLALVSSG